MNAPPHIDRTISVALCIIVYCISDQNFFPINNGSALLAYYSGHSDLFLIHHHPFVQITLVIPPFFWANKFPQRGEIPLAEKSAKQYLKGSWPKFESDRGTGATKAATPTRRTPTKPAPNLFIRLSWRMLVPTELTPLCILLLLTPTTLTSEESEEATCVGRCPLL